MTDDDTVEADPPYDLRPSGVVYVMVDGARRTLRRPTLGEFRAFREAHHEANLEVTRAGAALRAELLDLNNQLLIFGARAMTPGARDQRLHVLEQVGELDPTRTQERDRLKAAAAAGPMTADDDAEHAAAEVEVQTVMSKLDDASLLAWGGWTSYVLGRLGVGEHDPEDLDPALCSVDFTVALIEHWRNVTPLRGR